MKTGSAAAVKTYTNRIRIVPIVEHSAYRLTGSLEPPSRPLTWHSHQITTIPRASAVITTSALTGVSPGGREVPSRAGRRPERPPSNSTRACEFAAATRVASTEKIPASQARMAADPRYLSAISRNGTDARPIDEVS